VSLVTTCPSCGTSFRVTPEQLAAHRGDVRCGHCQHIFSALKQLEEITPPSPLLTDEAEVFPTVQPEIDIDSAPQDTLTAETDSEASPVVEHNPDVTAEPIHFELIEPDPAVDPSPTAALPIEFESHEDEDSLPEVHDFNIDADALELNTDMQDTEITAADDTNEIRETSDQPPPIGEQVEDIEQVEEIELTTHAGWNEETPLATPVVSSPPQQVPQEETFEPPPPVTPAAPMANETAAPSRRPKTWLLALLTFLLVLAAIVQTAYSLRNNIASRYPQATPILEGLCQPLRCSIDLPRQVDLLSIEDSDLKDDPEHEGVLILVSILDNRASFTQALPLLELTLTDTFDHPVLRRTFTPKEYLPAGIAFERGIAAGAQIPIRLNLGIEGAKPAGYRLYVKY